MVIYENIIRFFYLLVGCLYPAFASFKSLNGNDNDVKCSSNTFEAQRIWLSYWIVYGIYVIIDFLSQRFEAFIPLPFLRELKLLFLCWLLPSIGGGHKVIYDEFICSFLKQNENSIDQAIGRASESGSHMFVKFLNLILSHLITISESFLSLIRRNPKTEISHLRLTPSVEVIVSQILAKRRTRCEIIVPSNKSQLDLFQDAHEDSIAHDIKEAQGPPSPPPKPKKKQSSDVAFSASLHRIMHEHHEMDNLIDITKCKIISQNATKNGESC